MSQRTEQVGSLLVHEISSIIARELEPPRDCLITVMRAEVTPDLKHAKIFVSILPDNRTGTALEILKKNTGMVQKLLNQRLQMKFSPRISWELDLTTRKYAAIDEALAHEIKKARDHENKQ